MYQILKKYFIISYTKNFYWVYSEIDYFACE